MKAAIHPTYHKDSVITCSCGNTVKVGSTLPEISVELCNQCHPFDTGKQHLIDEAGRIDKFARLLLLSKKTLQARRQKTQNAQRLKQKNATQTLQLKSVLS